MFLIGLGTAVPPDRYTQRGGILRNVLTLEVPALPGRAPYTFARARQ